ncbi:MAG: hypothetical protein ABL998_22470 [Planctomycetota bacterium]
MRPWRALALLALATCAACAPAEPEPASAPAPTPPGDGAVLRVDGRPLTAAEVEHLADGVALLYPEYSRKHARRLALTNELLPRLAGHALQPERWEAARAACAAAFEAGALEPRREEGNFGTLGLGLWDAARRLEPGTWSEPIELFGRFVRVRLEERDRAPDPRAEQLAVLVLEFPYLALAEAHNAYDFALDRAQLEIVDPAWREAVPETWQHRMRPDHP